VPVEIAQGKGKPALMVDRDEGPRSDTSLEALGRLPPVFRKGGTVTAGNSSGLNDGAAAVLVASEARARALGLRPLARVVGGAAISGEARAVHAAATIIDLPADTPKLMARGYDLRRRHAPGWPLRNYGGHVDLPRMRDGNLKAQFFTFWTFPVPERGCAAEV